ncbi:hypothetical protein BSKO_05623 [Bryopsis sp. KO-2023]|nr:hypothetical protein BSKO_05623 [Bryopsis sp. KO-2023]
MATNGSSLELGCDGSEPHDARMDLLARLKKAKERQLQQEREEEKAGLLAKRPAPRLDPIPEGEAVEFEPCSSGGDRYDGPRNSWKYVRWGCGLMGALGVAGILVKCFTKPR